jgi:hypothetical protein
MRREHNLKKVIDKGKRRSTNGEGKTFPKSRAPVLGGLQRGDSAISSDGASSSKSGRNSPQSEQDQLVDLVVEDHDAEEKERVRARKEGGPEWNEAESKKFIKTYIEDPDAGKEIRDGFQPDGTEAAPLESPHLGHKGQEIAESPFAIADDEEDDEDNDESPPVDYSAAGEERHVWGE